MALQFVILHHVTRDGEHWDLMLEYGEALLTWRLDRDPHDAADLPISAKRIGDHRKAYLTYEGPVSRDRGHVRRVDGGAVMFDEQGEDRVIVRLLGRRLSGCFALTSCDDHWVFEAV